MSTIDNNKLIAEFMGFIECNKSTYQCCFGKINRVLQPQYMEFNTDWNWLMPVIEKILDISLNLDTMEMYYNITDCIPNITQTHIAVVDFIKWYNKQNN